MENLLKNLTFKDGLVPAVIVDAEDRQLLTLCYMDEDALKRTLSSGKIHVFRRSHGRVMKKGETSGHTQTVKEVRMDCAGNSLEFLVEQKVAACHKGYKSCYFQKYNPETDSFEASGEKIFEPDEVY